MQVLDRSWKWIEWLGRVEGLNVEPLMLCDAESRKV